MYADRLITVTPTLSVAGSYSSGDYVGKSTAPESFTGVFQFLGGPGTVKSLNIVDKTTTAAVPMELWLFSASFTAPTDNAAWAISDADAFNCVGVIPIYSSKWYASSNNKVYTDDTIALTLKSATRDLYFALVARGTTPSWTSGDLQMTIGVLQS